MSLKLQNIFAASTQKAADELIKAFLNLPDDKRGWSPDEKARPAINQLAECAILNGYTATLLLSKSWPKEGYRAYFEEMKRLSESWETVEPVFLQNTSKLIAAIEEVPDSELEVSIDMPWGAKSTHEIMTYPTWNMTYHLGQINYLASILGVLK
jgi:uncharacterized damage-inducible protein DinB